MPRINSSNWSVNDQITAARLQDFNEEFDDIYVYGTDRGRVRSAISGTPLRIDIGAFAYRVGANFGTYAGGTDLVVVNSATNYVQIDDTGTIVINQSGFLSTNGRLATVVCSGGAITSITIAKPDVIGGDLSTLLSTDEDVLSGNVSVDNTFDDVLLYDPDGAHRDVTLGTSGFNEGQEFYIKNIGDDYSLIVKQSSTVLIRLWPNELAHFIFDGTDWQMLEAHLDTGEFGDGSDGDATISMNTSLAANKQYDNLTIASGVELNPAGYIFRVRGVMTWGNGSSKVKCNGGNGGNGTGGTQGNGAAGGGGGTAGAAAHTGGFLPDSKAGVSGASGGAAGSGSANGSAGSSGTTGLSETNGLGPNGVGGGGGAGGGNGNPGTGDGAGGSSSGGTTSCVPGNLFGAATHVPVLDTDFTLGGSSGSGSGGGGGGGARWNPDNRNGGSGGGGGGSGAPGGTIWFAARIIIGAGIVEAKGGTGGNGGAGGNGADNGGGSNQSGNGGGGGGGGGGNGGVIGIVYQNIDGWTGSRTDVSGGTNGSGGASGTGGQGGGGGSNGTTGAAGKVFLIKRD